MGLKVASNSFCLSLNSSTSAVRFLSNQATASLHLPAIIVLSDSSNLSLMLESSIVDLILKQKDSKPFLASIFSFCFSSSALNFSDSSTIRSISSFDSLPWSLVIVIFSLLPPAFSTAETFKIPFASMSNVTSICGVPRGAGGIPVRLNCPKVVMLGHWPLSFEYLNRYCWLVVCIRCKCLGLFCRNSCVPFNQSCHHSTSGLNA